MLKKKPKQEKILSDKIAELIAPRRLLDPEVDSDDETAAKAFDYEIDDESENEKQTSAFSEIRKKNVKLLQDVDAKYRGKVSSRKDLDMDSEQSEDEIDSDVNEAQSENGDEDEEEEDQIESDSDDDDDLKAFAQKLKNPSKTTKEESDDGSDLETNSIDGLEKWDDEYEGEEIDEEAEDEENESDEMGEDEFDSDENEESDFDGGDIIPKTQSESNEPASVSAILPKKHTDDQVQKGACVQNQVQIWEKLLEVRIHSQKMLIKANSLPTFEKFDKLSNGSAEFADLAADTESKLFKLVSQMRELQGILLNQYPETKSLNKKRKSVAHSDDADAKKKRLSDDLAEDFSSFRNYQYSEISKWHDRTKVLAPGSIKTQKQQGNIDVVRKIEGVLANREELVKKSQLLKGGYALFDDSCTTVEPKTTRTLDDRAKTEHDDATENDNDVYCTEVYDDTDFYHTQLRELIEYKTNTSGNANEMAKQFSELQKLRKKMKKTFDTRASKGRKIRYVVHNKLVSFMAPNNSQGWNEEQKDELFKSLFRAQT